MRVIVTSREPFELGLEPAEFQAGQVWTIRQRFEHLTVITGMALATASRDLIIEQMDIDNKILVENVPASLYLARSAGTEGGLIAQLRACFRYQDHTLEEYRKAIDALMPGPWGVVHWAVPHGTNLNIRLRNPTPELVRCQVVLRGLYYVRQDAPE
jgi:hypothetical protein